MALIVSVERDTIVVMTEQQDYSFPETDSNENLLEEDDEDTLESWQEEEDIPDFDDEGKYEE